MTIFEALPELTKLIGKQVVWADDVIGVLENITIDNEDVWFVIDVQDEGKQWCSAVIGVKEYETWQKSI